MDKTNYSYVKVSAGLIFTLCMMLCVMSCDRIDNPIRYGGSGGKITPTVQQVVETVVNVTGANPSDVSAALGAIVTNEAVAAAAAKGEPIKVTVAGSGVSTGAADNKITIPQKNGANIEISFATAPAGTGSNALVLETSLGAGAIPGAANNNLTVTMPPSSGLAVTIELPTTTVTLKTDGSGNVVYQDVIAKTARSTIIIDKGVTIKEHELVGGNIVVKNGGKIETIALTVKDNFGFVSLGSWWSKIGFMETGLMEYYITNEDGTPYIPENIRIKKGGGNFISVETRCRADEYIKKVTVDKGLTIAYYGGDLMGQYKNIEGKGNTRLHTRSGINGEGKYIFEFSQNTEAVRNFTIANEIHDVEELYTDPAILVIVFNASDNNNTFTFENCVFENVNTQFVLSAKKYKTVTYYVARNEADPENWERNHVSTDLQDLLDAGVPNVEVEDGGYGGYWKDVRLDDDTRSLENQELTYKLIFKNCKIGGNDIVQDNVKFPKWGLWGPERNNRIKYQVIIEKENTSTTYDAVSFWNWENDSDPDNGNIELRDPNAAPPGPPAGD